MKNKAPLFLLIMSTIFASVGVIGGSLSWFSYKAEVANEDNPILGSVQDEYYASGTGAEDDPYIINKPRHLYNLAWLQYLGFYNKNDGGADDHQFYFKLGANVDMGEFGPIPPIGTEQNPFVGNFDGDGYAVSNVTISNDFSDYKAHPSVISAWNETDKKQPQILGFFGVLGDYENAVKPTEYSSSANEFVNTALSGVTVKSITDSSLMGIAVGYANDSDLTDDHNVTKNIIVDDSTLDIPDSGTTTSYGGFTDNISDYTLVGYTNNTSGIVKASKTINGVNKETNGTFPAPLVGDATGFGGSIGMDELFKRIDSFRNDTNKKQFSYDTGETHYFYDGIEDTSKTTYTSKTDNSYEYFDQNNDLRGRVVYGQTQTNYLWGKRTYTGNYTTTNIKRTSVPNSTCYYVLSSGYYLYLTGGNAGGTQTEANKTLLFEDADGWIYYEYNNQMYYLYASGTNNNTLRSSTTKETYMFRLYSNSDNTYLRLYQDNSSRTSYSRYVQYNSKSYRINGSQTAITQTTGSKPLYTTETTTKTYTYDTHGTYLPLNVYKAADAEKMASDQEKLTASYPGNTLVTEGAKYTNTGYIIGGTRDQSSAYGSAVRVDGTQYSFSNINRALGDSNSYSSDGSNLQILTRTKDSGGVTFIKDDYNKDVALSDNLTGLSYVTNKVKKSVTDLGLNSYNSARSNLHTQFGSATSNRLYVLRFNEFQVNLNHTITAEKVLLNGDIKTNYVFPESCIDFNLKQKGYISFFGGGFRGDDCNAFFSLYHIVRDDNDSITSFKRLNKIYGTASSKDPYIYEYRDSSSSGTKSYATYNKTTGKYESCDEPSKPYSEHFDMNWVEAPGFTEVDRTMWYFEIPVNEGEYALGAVDGRTGAYMMYLDVGSNAAQATRTIMYEKFIYNEQSFRFPTGVSLKSITIVSGSSSAIITDLTVLIDDSDSATMIVLAGANGDYALHRDDDSVTVNRANTELAPPTYASDRIKLYDEGGTKIDPTGNASSSFEIHRMTYYDYIPTNNSLLVTVIADYYTIDEDDSSLSHERRTIEQSTFADTNVLPADRSSVTPVVYDSADSSTADNLSNICVYKASGGGAYEADVLTSYTGDLAIDSTKLSSDVILEYRVIENGTETYTDSTSIAAIIDTTISDGTYYYYDFGGYVITLTPDGAGTVVVNISGYTNTFTMTTYDAYAGTSTTATITIDGTNIKIVINGVTVTASNQTIPNSANP